MDCQQLSWQDIDDRTVANDTLLRHLQSVVKKQKQSVWVDRKEKRHQLVTDDHAKVTLQG